LAETAYFLLNIQVNSRVPHSTEVGHVIEIIA